MSRKANPVKAVKKSYRKMTKAVGFTRRESKKLAREIGDIGHDVTVNVATEYAIGTIDTMTGFTLCAASGVVAGLKSAVNRTKKLQNKKVIVDVDIVEDHECSACEQTTDVN